MERLLESAEHGGVAVVGVGDARAEVVWRTAAAEGDAAVGGALRVDEQVAAVVERLAAATSRSRPTGASGSGAVAIISE